MRLKFDHRLISYYLEQEIEKIWSNGDLIPYTVVNKNLSMYKVATYIFTDNYHKEISTTNYYMITFYNAIDVFHHCYTKLAGYIIEDSRSNILYNMNFENLYSSAIYKNCQYKDLAKHLAEGIVQKIKESEEKAGREPV